ncbi:hypothetical protein LTR53_000726 [Teratosphaeriaceae sp. CCFEE 6253]|nr:hypothetical protein LTR53_000726 [Teratosphaeriaceae sp. CCFEE 6253]
MHYIRFLKTPKIEVQASTVILEAVITVTTDLGETFYPEDIDLIASLRASDQDGEIYLRLKLRWPGNARSLPISLDLSRQDVDWPACMHIAARTSASAPPPGFLPSVVDVWSGSLNPTEGLLGSGWRVERRFTSLAERTVSLLEDAGDSIARHLWDGSQALAQHIDQTICLQVAANPLPILEAVLESATYRRLNAIELGCGCGSVGISLAQSIPDCDVLLTDLPEVTELVEANIARMQPAMSSKVHFEPLDWEQPLPENLRNRINGLIIVSECTYNSDTLGSLVSTLSQLVARSPKAVIVVSTKTRHDSEAAFFDMMHDAGFVEGGSMRLPLPGMPGSGYADWATDVGLHVFLGSEHKPSRGPEEGSEVGVSRARSGRRPKPS